MDVFGVAAAIDDMAWVALVLWDLAVDGVFASGGSPSHQMSCLPVGSFLGKEVLHIV